MIHSDRLLRMPSALWLWALTFFVNSTVFTNLSHARVTFESRPHSEHIHPNENLEVQFTLTIEGSHDVGEIELPTFEDFQLVTQDQSTGQQIQIINGKITRTQTTTALVILSPQKKGRLMVGSASIRVDGRTYKTKTFYVSVDEKAPRAQTPPPSSDPWQQLMEEEEKRMQQLLNRGLGLGQRPDPSKPPTNNPSGPAPEENFEVPRGSFFLRAVPSRERVFKGEQLTNTYYLYVEEGQRIQSLEYDQLPHLKGFWKIDRFQVEDMNQLRWESVKVGNRFYRRTPILDMYLYPISEGKKTIDPLKLKVGVLSGARRGFGFGFPQVYHSPTASKSVSILVDPLPMEGRTKDFSGAVGNFTIHAEPVPAEVPINKAFAFRVRIEGQGNFNALDQINFVPPSGLEFFESKTEFKDNAKVFESVLIPRTPGPVTLPSVPFTFFDPAKKKYISIATSPLTLTVTGQAGDSPTQTIQNPFGKSGPADPQVPPFYLTIPSQRIENLWTPVAPYVALTPWAFLLGFSCFHWVRRRQSMRETAKVTPLGRHLRDWKKRFGKTPPSAAQIDEIRFRILENMVRHLPSDRSFQPTRDRSTELQLDEAKALGLNALIFEETRQIFSQLDSLAFGDHNIALRQSTWLSTLAGIEKLASR